MKKTSITLLMAAVCAASLLPASAHAQAEPGRPNDSKVEKTTPAHEPALVTRMMAFDKNHDGRLTRDEVTDTRLLRLFDRADANKDGLVTRDELMALAAKMEADSPQAGDDGGPGFGGPGGPAGPGGPDGPGGRRPRGFDNPGGRGGPFGPPPRPGTILPPMLRDRLNLTPEQTKQLDALQKDVDEKLAKILTDDQRKELQQMRGRGPGRGGPPQGDRPAPPPPPPGEQPE